MLFYAIQHVMIYKVANNMIINKTSFNYYGFLLIFSIFVGIIYIYYFMRKEKYNKKDLLLYFLMLMFFTLVLGKMFTLLVSPNNDNILTVGFSSYGGLIGVISSAIIFEKIIPMDNKLIKYSIISLPLIYSISKIGCFIAGCCHGIPYNGPFNVIYTEGFNIPVFPVQIIETIVFFILFIVCHLLKNNKYVIYITVLLCALFKFLLDFLRYEHINKAITANQIFSIILIIGIFIVLFINKKKELSK